MDPIETAPSTNPLVPYRDVEIVDTQGKTQGVRIHELKIAQFDKAAELIMDEIGLIQLCSGKPAGWVVANVTPRSLEPLAIAVKEVNPDFFKWAGRRMAMLQSVAPGAVETILGRAGRV